MTQDRLIPGLGNSIAQEVVLFQARLHSRHPLNNLNQEQRQVFYRSIRETVNAVIEQGGRYDEVDLYGRPGDYVRLMDSKAADRPCPICGQSVEMIQYLGGACYFCPDCQR